MKKLFISCFLGCVLSCCAMDQERNEACSGNADLSDVNAPVDQYENRLLHLAAILSDVNAPVDQYENRLLHLAAILNRSDVIVSLADNGADINVTNRAGWTPLMNAVAEQSEEACRVLLERGAKFDQCDECGWTILHLAASTGNPSIMKMFPLEKKYINARDFRGNRPIDTYKDNCLLCGAEEDPRILEMLCLPKIYGTDDLKDFMYEAVAREDFFWIKAIMREMPSVVNETVNELFRWTPLHAAVHFRKTNVADFLIKAGATLNPRDKEGETPLLLAVENNDEEMIKFLVANGADINARDAEGKDALHYMVRRTRDPKVRDNIIRFLLESNSIRRESVIDAFFNALNFKYSSSIVKIFLDKYPQLSVMTYKSNTPLHALLERQFLFLIREPNVESIFKSLTMLLDSIDSVKEARRRRNAPIFITDSDTSDVHIIAEPEWLYDPVNARDASGNTPLHILFSAPIITGGAPVELLIRHGADVGAVNNRRETPLIRGITSKFCNIDAIKVLLENERTDVNATNEFGYTALHLIAAADNRYYRMDHSEFENFLRERAVELLRHPEINVDLRTPSRRTAEELAVETGKEFLVDMIREHREQH